MTTPTTSTTVPIDFCNDAAAVPLPHTRIVATRDAGDAPRSSRYVSFVDDGKLFEGHLTVQSRSLKSILQHLVDRQEEQALVLRALQDDVTSLQATATRAARIEQRMSVLYSGGGASAAAAATATATAANATGSTGSAVSTHELSTLRRRLTALEHFVALWGAKAKDVSELVQRHGEPVVTPDAYTAYLLELAPFRATRREARATALSAATTTTTTTSGNNGSALAAAASAAVHGSELGTAARRRLTALSVLQPGNVMATAGSGSGGADDVAQRALQTAEQAMTLLRELQQQRHVMPRLSSMPPTAAAGDGDGDAETAATTSGKPRSDSAAGGVDVQARSDIAQLHDYLQRKMTEIDARLTLATLSGKAAAHGSGGSHATTAAATVGRHAARRTSNQRASVTAAAMPAATQTLPSSSSTAAPPQETIDAVARDDAAASLALIEELESVVDRRLRELAMSIANLSLQVHNNNNNNNNNSGNSNSGSVTSDTSAVADAGGSDRTPRRGKAHASSRPHAAAVASSPSRASDDNKGGGASNTSHVAAAAATTSPTAAATTVVAVAPPVVDTVARDELTSLAEHVADMEDDARRRWQTLEERLRVLGRACMSRPVAFAAATSPSSMVTGAAAAAAAAAAAMSSGGVAYDRKAREDAALSLMRIAHVERDVQTLRRLVQGDAAATAATARACATVVDACRDGDESAAPATVAAPTPLRDTYGGRVYMLEAEVQQRMAEVNRAIALLRDSERRHNVNVDVDVDKLLSEHSSRRRDGDADAHAATQMPQQQRDDDNNKDDVDEDTRSTPAAAAAATSASLPGVLVLHSHDKAATRAAIAAAPQTQRSDHGDGAATRVRAHDATPTRYARSYSHDTSATTVAMRTSRLRSPDARVFCAPLVEQVTMAVSLPTSARSGVTTANNDDKDDDDDDAATRTAASRLVHTTTTPRGGSVAQPTADAHDKRSDDDNDVVGTRLRPHKSNAATAAAAATMPTDTSRPRAHARRGERASVLRAQHAQPCVIADCAWCAGEAEALRSASTATAAAAHS